MKSVTELPFNRFVGIEASNAPSLLRLPAGSQYLNHIGSVHASALLALAEASSGECLLREFGSEQGLIPLVRRIEAKFRKPAQGEVVSVASFEPEALEKTRSDLAAKGRALVAISVELQDSTQTHVLSATVEWFIQRGLA